MREEIYISYAWHTTPIKGEYPDSMVDAIAKKLENHFKLAVDVKEINYKGDIRKFEEKLGRGTKIILVVSDKFLKSKHCMYEILKITEKGDVYKRIFPIVLSDADIYTAQGILKYTKHWEDEKHSLEQEVKNAGSQAYLTPVHDEINRYAKFREIIADFLAILSNMNTLNAEQHKESDFEELINALYGGKPRPDFKAEIDYISRIKKINGLFDTAIAIVAREIKEQNTKAEEILERIKYFKKQCNDQTFQIAVMAIVKSGKSTFLNALLGDEYLPVSNVAETSVPVRISHFNSKHGALMFGNSKIEGVGKIRQHIENTNKIKRDEGYKHEVEFNLNASFKALEEKEMTDIKFEILDTPGFGEALVEITVGKSIDQSNSELLDKISAIIYLLDYTKLKTKDEDKVLEKLTDMRSDILEKISDRLFFVINKIDEEDRNSLPPEKVVDYVYHLIKKKMPNVRRQHFFTVSASRALLSRLILFDRATENAKKDFGKIAFGFRANKKDDSEYKELAKEILAASNITEVESHIIQYIFENRSRIFTESLQDNLKRLLQEFKNKFVITAEGVLNRTFDEITDLEKEIEKAKKKQENIQDEAEKFEKEIKEWIDIEFKSFELNITDQIDSAFNIEKAEEKRSFFGRLIPNWVKRIHDSLMQVEEMSQYTSKEDLEELIRKLNAEINQELANSFGTFRRKLENALGQKQKVLFANLKQTIDSLARDFESTLEKGLRVELIDAEVRFEEPDFDRTLMKADALINKFVKTDWSVMQVQKQERYYNERANCFLGGYRTRTYYEDQYFAENKVSKASLEIFWKKVLDEKYQNAKFMINKLLDKNIKEQIKNARNSFNSYVGDYLSTIQEKKIKLSNSDKTEIAEQLRHLKDLNKSVTGLIQELSN